MTVLESILHHRLCTFSALLPAFHNEDTHILHCTMSTYVLPNWLNALNRSICVFKTKYCISKFTLTKTTTMHVTFFRVHFS